MQVTKLQSDLHTKANGNKMLGALMRAFRQKLEEEVTKNRKVIEDQDNQIMQYSQVVQDQNAQMQSLQARVEKKKFKSTQSKKVMAAQEQKINELQSRVG